MNTYSVYLIFDTTLALLLFYGIDISGTGNYKFEAFINDSKIKT